MKLLDLIGNTPLLHLEDIFQQDGINVYAKAEWRNPGGSLKDRPVKRMLMEAIKNGDLTKDKTIIDSSSGNAGIAYSMIGNSLGYKVQIVIPGNASRERKERMISHGTLITETDAIEGYDEALRHVHRLVDADPHKYFLCDQYANDNNWLSHYHGTAEEIIQQVNGSVDYFVGGVGTGGSITGIGRKLKERFPHITIVGVRPEIWPGIEGLKPLGSPEDIVPKIFDETMVDEWIEITADEAKNWANSVARKGYFVGQSSGSYLAATSKLLEKINSGNVVTIFNDIGERYFSSGLWS
ncbi:MAG: PLP-dependent cysteine synthase family protein [Candidatus Marinimicrobia bacterium]|nr:PLP-dependent cysteine synthase family protein [Candidatus Neomarinimicrobiota bacterium]